MKDPKTKVIGWREWVALPDLGITATKAKIDTGARSSALHAFDIETFSQQGKDKIRFKVHPQQRDTAQTTIASADILDRREVRNSGGHAELRYTILTSVEIGGLRWLIELTLTNRDTMGFRMLLGRQAIRSRFLVDPGSSFLLGTHSQPTSFTDPDRVKLKE
ncbi:MAG: RimK/LysX family protein [Geitlerinemataceae cyanobacterium]